MTKNLPANPLSALIKAASQSLPTNTGATALAASKLHDHSGTTVILADVSGSMSQMADTQTKIDILREAIKGRAPQSRLVAFSSEAQLVDTLPPPSGTTALHKAFDFIAPLRPALTLLISDGEPDDKAKALLAAQGVSGIINVLYCGPDHDKEAIAFMHGLARAHLGTVTAQSFAAGIPALGYDIQRLSLPPA